MRTVNRYWPFALVALVAGLMGWGFSALALNQRANTVAVQPAAAPALNLAAPLAETPLAGAAALVEAPLPQPVAQPIEQAAPVVRRSAARAHRAPSTVATAETRAADAEVAPTKAPVQERKGGLSNKAKTAIVIGGGAATGAAIGAIAGGKKGAAIGAIAGGGGGALYSWIKHKKQQPVF